MINVENIHAWLHRCTDEWMHGRMDGQEDETLYTGLYPPPNHYYIFCKVVPAFFKITNQDSMGSQWQTPHVYRYVLPYVSAALMIQFFVVKRWLHHHLLVITYRHKNHQRCPGHFFFRQRNLFPKPPIYGPEVSLLARPSLASSQQLLAGGLLVLTGAYSQTKEETTFLGALWEVDAWTKYRLQGVGKQKWCQVGDQQYHFQNWSSQSMLST